MNPGPFGGLLIVDLTRVLAGPFCTMMLADLGARVIKVENPAGGDDSRQFEPFFDKRSAYFLSLNRGKESIALDLKKPDDAAVMRRMLCKADVLVENYRPGTLDRLGFGYDRLVQENPRLIFASVSGFGQTGPWRHKPAYDMIVQAQGGLMSITGQPDGPPTKAGTSIGDITGGLFTALGIASALYHREKTGLGMRVDVSMLDGQIAILEHAIMRYAALGQVSRPIGNKHPSINPFGSYTTADRPIVIAVGNDSLFAKMCYAIARTELIADPRFAKNPQRVKNADELQVIIENVLTQKPAAHWIAMLEEAGVPCCLINNVKDAVEHPQVQARNMIVSANGLRIAGNPVKLSAFPDPPTRTPAPDLDADGERIRREFE